MTAWRVPAIDPQPWWPGDGGVTVRVRLTPKSSADAVEAVTATATGPALAVRVRAPPADGAANTALIRLFGEWLGVAQRTVQIASGGKSRVKSLTITGDPRLLGERLATKIRQLQP